MSELPSDILKCKNCKFWSNTTTRRASNGCIEAMCENSEQSIHRYTKEFEVCNLFEKKEK